ncbi:hypothetical protein [Thermus oshimai]|uniref:hypothetical protein n=1 Tax=Thermus oshimai TaxID=56957 RepID=UPI0011819AB6|nr:hypothetical protein [Thermus oshimai]
MELKTLSSGEGRGRMREGDLALRIGIPDFPIDFFVSALELNRPVTKRINLPQIVGVPNKLVDFLEQADIPEAYLFQTLTLTLPVGYVRAEDLAVCPSGESSACSGTFQGIPSGATEFRFETNRPVRVVGEASAFLNRLGKAPFEGEVAADLRLTPLADLGDLLAYVGQEGCSILGCNIRQQITGAYVLAPFGARATSGVRLVSKPLASPISALPADLVAEVQRYTVVAGLTLRFESRLPTEVLGFELWAGQGDVPRFDSPNPQDFVYQGSDPIPAAPVDPDGRAVGVVVKEITVELQGESLRRFLGLLSQPNVHAALRLTLRGPQGTGGVFRYTAQDYLKVYAKGTARLRIGGADQ